MVLLWCAAGQRWKSDRILCCSIRTAPVCFLFVEIAKRLSSCCHAAGCSYLHASCGSTPCILSFRCYLFSSCRVVLCRVESLTKHPGCRPFRWKWYASTTAAFCGTLGTSSLRSRDGGGSTGSSIPQVRGLRFRFRPFRHSAARSVVYLEHVYGAERIARCNGFRIRRHRDSSA